MTIDSFARAVLHRWQSLAASHNLSLGDFDQTCDACGQLLEQPQVARWVARTYPVLVVDEAQELSAPRLRIIRALTDHVAVFIAADEFQCLNTDLDTTPFMVWFRTGNIAPLTRVYRTTRTGLLNAGIALRRLEAPLVGSGLSIGYEFPNIMPFEIGAALKPCRH